MEVKQGENSLFSEPSLIVIQYVDQHIELEIPGPVKNTSGDAYGLRRVRKLQGVRRGTSAYERTKLQQQKNALVVNVHERVFVLEDVGNLHVVGRRRDLGRERDPK